MGASRTENFHICEIVIPQGESLSLSHWVEGIFMVGFFMPAGWNAAVLTAQGSFDGNTWVDIYDTAGNEWSATVAASRYCLSRTDRPWLGGIKYVRFRSGTAALPVVQDTERTFQFTWAYPNA